MVSPLPQSLDPTRHIDPGASTSSGQPYRVERALHSQRLQPHSPGLAEAPFLCVNKCTASSASHVPAWFRTAGSPGSPDCPAGLRQTTCLRLLVGFQVFLVKLRQHWDAFV